jgi:cell division protein FtsW (lipid II flippase)
MNKYKADMAIKNWLEYRIKDIEQEVKFTSRHGIFLYAGAFCIGFLIYFLNLYFSKSPINAFSITVGIVIITLTVLISRFTYKRKYNKTLDELKELYQHLENNDNE